jgi:DNA invertase Pin-like site-specific DNA recombinase
MSAKPTIRCAIYTRKSTDEGLEQEFNSLDAQYEACAAYIQSQRHEGWKLIPERFDDGGLSGGTLDRPALKRLLAEIDAGRVGMVAVYKIDRLTRSLADFVRLVERLDAKGCSFVSVTQAFNTSSSMGRLTLNMLLSFAQFEREVTAERIRDKIAASKKKGLWMGGSLALGYDRPDPPPAPRVLKVNPREAQTVRALFDLHASLGTLAATRSAALARGLSYYTGCIFEVKVNNVAMGSVSGGGRYDNLTGVFGLPGVSGVGFSFGVDRLYDVLDELNLFPEEAQRTSSVLVCHLDAECRTHALRVVQTLRINQIAAEVYPDVSKLKKQLEYADRKKIPYAIVIGSDEVKTGNLTMKNMKTGEQHQRSLTEILASF